MSRWNLDRTGMISRPWLLGAGLVAVAVLLGFLMKPPDVSQGPSKSLVLACPSELREAVAEVCAAYQKEYGACVRIEADALHRLGGKTGNAAGPTDLYLCADDSQIQVARSQKRVAEILPVARRPSGELVVVGVDAGTLHPAATLHFARYTAARDRGGPIFVKHGCTPLDDADLWEDRPSLVLMAGAMLKPAIDERIKAFSRREGVTINTIYAGCGIHVAQMKAMKSQPLPGKHFPDAYFSCDVSFMRNVQAWFEAAQNISRNDMVLVVARGNPKQVRSLADLGRTELRVGLAHPQNSALGALTDDLLKKLDLHEKVYAGDRPVPIVHADAGHMLVNQMRTGALDAIVVYRSNVLSSSDNARQSLEIVQINLPDAIAIQPFAVAKDSGHKYLMRRLLETILSTESQRCFRDAGFTWVAEERSP